MKSSKNVLTIILTPLSRAGKALDAFHLPYYNLSVVIDKHYQILLTDSVFVKMPCKIQRMIEYERELL